MVFALSSELPEGLSSSEREAREATSEATPSVFGSPWVNKSWKTMSYFSKVDQDDIDRMRSQYQISEVIVLRILDSDKKACCPKFDNVAFYEADFQAGLRFPLQLFVSELLDFLSMASGQVAPNGWRTVIACMVIWRVSSNGQEDLTMDEFLFCYELSQIVVSLGWTFKN